MGKVTLKLNKKFEKAIKEVHILSELRLFFGVVDTKKKIDGMLVIDYMNINELGSSKTVDKNGRKVNLPARPFFRKVLFQQRVAYIKITKEQFALVAQGEKTARNAMIYIGEYLKKAVVASIHSNSYVLNATSTIKAKKGRGKTLINVGNGLEAVGFRIYKGKTIIYKDIGGNI